MYNSHSITFIIDGVMKNTWDDWHLVPSERPTMELPSFKSKVLDIPGSDGVLDISTSLTGYPVFDNRTGSFNFVVMNDRPEGLYSWIDVYSDLAGFLNGRSGKMILADDDPDYYYEGRFSLTNWSSSRNWSTVTIGYNVGPYKWRDDNTPAFKNIPVDSDSSLVRTISKNFYGIAPVVAKLNVALSGNIPVGAKFSNPTLGTVLWKEFSSGVYEVPEFVLYGDSCSIEFNPEVPTTLFDPKKRYSEGDYVIYMGSKYVCIKNIIPTSSWRLSDWTWNYDCPEFDPTSSYYIGDKVSRVSNVYSCTEDVVPESDFNVSNWDYLSAANQYSSESTYEVGAYVIHNHKIYKCITSIDIPEEFDSTKWDEVSNDYEFDGKVLYHVGDHVIYNDEIYVCVEDVIPSTAFDPTQWDFVETVPFYLNTKTYSVGDAVLYNDPTDGVGKYVCSSPVTPSKSFTSSDWATHSGYLGGGSGVVSINFRKGLM